MRNSFKSISWVIGNKNINFLYIDLHLPIKIITWLLKSIKPSKMIHNVWSDLTFIIYNQFSMKFQKLMHFDLYIVDRHRRSYLKIPEYSLKSMIFAEKERKIFLIHCFLYEKEKTRDLYKLNAKRHQCRKLSNIINLILISSIVQLIVCKCIIR